MTVFEIKQNNWNLSMLLVNYTESDDYDLGYEYEARLEIKCTGFEARTSTFYFTNRILHEFYNDLKCLYKVNKRCVFQSDAEELKLRFDFNDDGVRMKIKLAVEFEEIQTNDQLRTEINLDFETLPYTIKDLDDFFLSFPVKG